MIKVIKMLRPDRIWGKPDNNYIWTIILIKIMP